MSSTGAVELVATRDDLWKLAEGCPPSALIWMSIGWRLGLIDGYDHGWHSAQDDMALRWHRVYLQVLAMAGRPTLAEVRHQRGEAS